MPDRFSKETRSRVMSHVKGRHTQCELRVRRLLHSMGFRFRLHRADLPGKPDIVLPKYRKVVFVHGCFWHGHAGCPRAKRPSTNREFWDRKLDGNIARDAKAINDLKLAGWGALVIWQCELREIDDVAHRIRSFIFQ